MIKPLQIVRTIADLRCQRAEWQAAGERVALVPTMGALHQGHLSLIACAQAHAQRVMASIFVNPLQFGVHEDLSRYPRDEARDAALLAAAGCHLLFAPTLAEIYPQGFATQVMVPTIASPLCGTARPGHFDGVATVVAKLLIMATPDVAVFGEKDFQQLTMIRRLVQDLNLPTQIIGAPLVRDADGLALSSRNVYLSPEERRQALALPQSLTQARHQLLAGIPVARALDDASKALSARGFDPVDYVELRYEDSLAPANDWTPTDPRPARLFGAGSIGKTRLIDNMSMGQAMK